MIRIISLLFSVLLFIVTCITNVIHVVYAQSEPYYVKHPCRRIVSSIIIDNEKNETIYMKYFTSKDNILIGYKSINGGEAWNKMSDETGRVAALIKNPNNAPIIYDIVDNNLKKSTNNGKDWVVINVIWDKSIAFAAYQKNPKIIYAYGVNEIKDYYWGKYERGGIYKSANEGADWDLLLPADEINNLAIDPNNPDIIYAGTRYRGVYRTTNGGEQWNTVKNGLPANEPINVLVIDPVRSNIIYIGTRSGVFRSNDHGLNWHSVSDGLPNYINNGLPRYSDVLTLTINAQNPAIIYAGTNYDGVFKSTNGGELWKPINEGIPCSD